MSDGYYPKNADTQSQALKVEELAVSQADFDLYKLSSGSGSGPSLGDASNFAILASSAVTNTGSSVINGDVGVYAGTSVSGFPPGTVVGGSIHIADAAAQAAKTSAQALFTALGAMSATPITAALDGQTLSAGVYTESSGTFNLAASGNGTLTLNGSASDVFVFKASSTLVTGAGGIPTINLTGGALAQNVYWQIGSSATINAGSAGPSFPGTVVAQASITDTLGGVINGRFLALTGAVTLSAATVMSLPGGGSSCVFLIREPVTKIYQVSCKINSTNSMAEYSQSSLSIVDSVSGLPGGDLGGIKVAGLSMAANDCATLRYSTKQ